MYFSSTNPKLHNLHYLPLRPRLTKEIRVTYQARYTLGLWKRTPYLLTLVPPKCARKDSRKMWAGPCTLGGAKNLRRARYFCMVQCQGQGGQGCLARDRTIFRRSFFRRTVFLLQIFVWLFSSRNLTSVHIFARAYFSLCILSSVHFFARAFV